MKRSFQHNGFTHGIKLLEASMEMHQIRYFLAVCDHSNFTRAAQFTYVSQPSLTQAIKKLEDELGGELFVRNRSGCQLTDLGRLVEPNLRKIFKDSLATKAEALRFTHLHTIPIRIGLMATIGAQRLNPVLARYQQEFPHIELELLVDCESILLRQLQQGTLDLVISAPTQLLGQPYASTPIYQERYVVAFNPAHRFSQLPHVTLTDMQTEPYLDRLNCELRDTLKSICQDQAINLYASYRSNSEEWIVNMVRAGIGVALMPEYTLPEHADDISFRYLADPAISRQVYAIYAEQLPQKTELKMLINSLACGL